MTEKVKDKDAEPEESKTSDLEEGLEETFPGSDPASANQPGHRGDEKKGTEGGRPASG